jgi:hypothetical protein
MNDLTPSEGGEGRPNADHAEAKQSNSQHQRSGQARKILDREQCLAGLSQLPGLLAVGLVKAPIANAIRAAYHELLQQHERDALDATKSTVPDDDVLAILRARPELLSLLEPFLTDEQLKKVMREATDGNQEA